MIGGFDPFGFDPTGMGDPSSDEARAAAMWAKAVGPQDDQDRASLLAAVHDLRWPKGWVPPAVLGVHELIGVQHGRVLVATVTVAEVDGDPVVVLAELIDRTGEGSPAPDGW